MNLELLEKSKMKGAMTSLIQHAEYFSINARSFKLALAFVASRILRANECNEAWRESNIALIYSEAKNCGKSLTLRLLAYLQGAGVPHPLIFTGGNAVTSGTSLKLMLQKVTSTTLVSLLDDPKMTESLSEFLVQLQSGLAQGSSTGGICKPKGSMLIASNNVESSRLEGRLLRFNFQMDPSHSAENEHEIVDFVKANEGLIVAWGMALMELWPKVLEKQILIKRILQNAPQSSVPNQHRWREAVAKLVLVYAMVHATADYSPGIVDLLHTFVSGNAVTVPVLDRLQMSILKCLQDEDDSILMWINPSVHIGQNKAQALAIRRSHFNNFDVSWSEVLAALQQRGPDVAEISRSVGFAKNRSATLAHVRSKSNPKHVASAAAVKICHEALDDEFIDWINYYVTGKGEPPLEYNPTQLPTGNLRRRHPEVGDVRDGHK